MCRAEKPGTAVNGKSNSALGEDSRVMYELWLCLEFRDSRYSHEGWCSLPLQQIGRIRQEVWFFFFFSLILYSLESLIYV